MKAVNLLPPEMRGAAKSPDRAPAAPAPGGAGPLVVLGALALAVVAVAAFVLTGNTIKDRKAELATAKSAHAETMAQVNALKPYADFAAMATARVSTVQALAQSRFDWEQALRDLSRALPADVHLTALKGDLGAATSSAGGSALRGAITAPAISLQGCTDTHGDVARLMSRLRNVRGVTRVSLASSTKAETAAAPATAGGAEGDQPAQLCPKGEPPSFDLVVFFEGSSAVPASAAGAPATSTPAGTSTPAAGAAPAATPAPGAAATPTATPAAGAAATQPASSTSTTGAP